MLGAEQLSGHDRIYAGGAAVGEGDQEHRRNVQRAGGENHHQAGGGGDHIAEDEHIGASQLVGYGGRQDPPGGVGHAGDHDRGQGHAVRHAAVSGDGLDEGHQHQIGGGGHQHGDDNLIIHRGAQHFPGGELLEFILPQHLGGLPHVVFAGGLAHQEGGHAGDRQKDQGQGAEGEGNAEGGQQALRHRGEHHHGQAEKGHGQAGDQAVLSGKPLLQGVQHGAVGQAAAQAGDHAVGQIDHGRRAGADQRGQKHAQAEHQAAGQGDQPGGELLLHQAAQNVSRHKAGDHQGGGHGYVAGGPAVMLHHIGLKDRPHVQNALAEHQGQPGGQHHIFLPFGFHCAHTLLIKYYIF